MNHAAADAPPACDDALVHRLRGLLGPDAVETAADKRVFFSTDIFTRGETSVAVIAPRTVEQLSQAVALATEAGHTVVPRGGGFSYTQGYVPIRPDTITVDLRHLNRIREINAEDLYVVVEAGVTWTDLYDALKAKGLRTPYFGPMSGYRATVGGALSQGSFFLGSTQYGTTADSVLGLEVVLADGTRLTTGSAASTRADHPFFRNFGPDLTGLFLNDTGALGFKAVAMLKLIPFPEHHRYASFAFDDEPSALAALSDVARAGLAAECYLWDPPFGAQLRSRNSMLDNMRYLGGVLRSGRNPLAGAIDGLRLALRGKRTFDGKAWLLHCTIDDPSDAGAEGRLQRIRAIADGHGAAAVEPSAPRAMRGMPFNDFLPLMTQAPEQRNLPTHGIYPHSRIRKVTADARAFFARNADRMAKDDITVGTIFFAIGANAVCIEPLFYWTDDRLAIHDRGAERSALDDGPVRAPAGEAVAALRKELVELFSSHGAVHCQIGKSYPYREALRPETYGLLEAVKTAVDPRGLVNPGSLGLAR
ncbi:FAD-binding oxidoreductase [Sphingomonas sp. CGMCC 1.13654]|uniref:D-lactate dehydrogenase (cytochrome) n=1 Tax=Sphingomonas chungangi TaxID=2683589 RepID=A0A838L6M8_9SPHN|nr:FAD-binding oxidoreductase [Sphingomonas chungangi]MBA2934814.1 FAD-binding oxidoreductase [Sphingomonas chungangi]MVW58125.1 FAD-binding protein [Sphingomonas chungangi]